MRDFEEEKAVLEDALYSDPKDSEKYDVCQGSTLTFVSSDKYDKEDCKADGGEWEDGWCDTNCYIDGKKIGKNDYDRGICD